MTKVSSAVQKPTNGGASASEKTGLTVIRPVQSPNFTIPEEKNPVPEVKKELTLTEKIQKVENLQLIVEKRTKLVQTRSEIERFQTASNDFNCSLRLNDSDGNVFTTSFTPGIKKVIEFLKSAFDASISEVEQKINF
ncbi:MAG: hypothetical protein WCK09_00340 [Bacteroidota bacterium]